jgi:hypothetical protein
MACAWGLTEAEQGISGSSLAKALSEPRHFRIFASSSKMGLGGRMYKVTPEGSWISERLARPIIVVTSFGSISCRWAVSPNSVLRTATRD